MPIYATVEKLAEVVTPADLDKLDDGEDVLYIREASSLVRDATKCDLYDTTPAGLPSDPEQAEAMAAATCLQVREWIRNGIDPLAGRAGVAPAVTAASTNGSSLSYDAAGQTAARTALLTGLTESARKVLREVGLGSAMVDRR